MKKFTKKQIEDFKTGAIILLGVIVVLGIIYIVSNNTGNNTYKGNNNSSSTSTNGNQQTSNPLLADGEEISEDEQKDLPTMGYSDLEKALKNGDKKFVFLGSDGCSWCNYQKPILKYLVYKYGVDIYYLNLGYVSSNDYTKITQLHDDLASFGTPTFIVVDGGKVTVVEQGARGTDAMVNLLSTNGFISE